jgi:CDP-diacylglycerol---glycerol-3-phosphate 3-phosphatidyltransferase
MLFIIPIPHWVIDSSYLSFIHSQMTTINHFIIRYGNYIGAIIFIIAASTDKVDGYIARKRNMITKFGIFLDPIADKLIITAALIALVQREQLTGWAAMIIIAREFIVTGLRLVAAGEKVVLPAGAWGKIKMVAQSIAVALTLLKNFPFSIITNIAFDRYAMGIALIITIYSGYDYIMKNKEIIINAGM